jgi:hypothetical protein
MISRFKIKKHYLGKESFGNTVQEQPHPQTPDIAEMMKQRRSQSEKPSNNILPFDRKQNFEKLPKPEAQQSQSSEVPAFITDAPKNIANMVGSVPKTIISKTRPGLVQADDFVEDWFLNGTTKIRGFLSGIGGFFKSIPAMFGANPKGKK